MKPHRLRWIDGPQGPEPAVSQGTENGWTLTWNPDTERIHVHHPAGDRTFKEWRNALGYAKRRQAPCTN